MYRKKIKPNKIIKIIIKLNLINEHFFSILIFRSKIKFRQNTNSDFLYD